MNRQQTENRIRLFNRLETLGFTFSESCQLLRIERTLSRWSEFECGMESGNIQRDETGKPFFHRSGFIGYGGKWIEPKPYAIADKEKGAIKRLEAIVDARNKREVKAGLSPEMDKHENNYVFSYNQGDPRGCSVYLLTKADLQGQSPNAAYYRGLAVCA